MRADDLEHDLDPDFDRVTVLVDGRPVVMSPSPSTSLLRGLREAGHTATTGACEQGECGSCTVLLDGRMICSCLVPAAVCDGSSVVTVTGLVRPDLAEALARHGAVQCGFCTPGFVVAAETLLSAVDARSSQVPTMDEVREALSGNLCRCTGYEGLLAAVHETARSRRS